MFPGFVSLAYNQVSNTLDGGGTRVDDRHDEDRDARVRNHVTAVLAQFDHSLRNDQRFPEASRLLTRFRSIAAEVVARTCPTRALHEAHNELCVAASLLAEDIRALAYEPSSAGTSRTIDFRATTRYDETVFVDVKTIHPEDLDRWDKFEHAQRQGWIPPWLELSKYGMGGEIWHSMFAARSRMLEYSLELEGKIAAGMAGSPKASAIMMFCGNGFDWGEDELEDFVAFYSSGRHRFDDPFRDMERHSIAEMKVVLAGTISRFGYLKRPGDAIEPTMCLWNVRPPEGTTC